MKDLIGRIRKFGIREAPTILTVVSIASMASAIIFAIKDTPKAIRLKEEAEAKKGEPLTKIEVVKTCAPCYAKTIIFAGLSGFASFSANRIHKKRYAALLASSLLTEAAFQEYKDQVKEYLGDKKEKEKIVDAISQKRVDENPIKEGPSIVWIGDGDALFYEPITRTYFRSDKFQVEKKANRFTQQMFHSDFGSFDDWLETLGLPRTDPSKGEIDGSEIGWGTFTTGMFEISFSLTADNKDRPCFALIYTPKPSDKYMSLY